MVDIMGVAKSIQDVYKTAYEQGYKEGVKDTHLMYKKDLENLLNLANQITITKEA